MSETAAEIRLASESWRAFFIARKQSATLPAYRKMSPSAGATSD
jgi:hypothetical protein